MRSREWVVHHPKADVKVSDFDLKIKKIDSSLRKHNFMKFIKNCNYSIYIICIGMCGHFLCCDAFSIRKLIVDFS